MDVGDSLAIGRPAWIVDECAGINRGDTSGLISEPVRNPKVVVPDECEPAGRELRPHLTTRKDCG